MRPTTSTFQQSTTPRTWSMSSISACSWVWPSSSESTQEWAEIVSELVSHAGISHEMAAWARIQDAQTARPQFTIVSRPNSLKVASSVSRAAVRNHSLVKNGSSKSSKGVVDAKVSHLMHRQPQACFTVREAAMTRKELEKVRVIECFTVIQQVVCLRTLSPKNTMKKSLIMVMAWLAVRLSTKMTTLAFTLRSITREIRTSNSKLIKGFINQIKRHRITLRERRKEAFLHIRLQTMILL